MHGEREKRNTKKPKAREEVRKAVKMECKYWKQLHDTRLGLLKWLQATLFARSLWSSLVIIYDATTFVSPTESKEWHTNTRTPIEYAHTHIQTQIQTHILWTHAERKRKKKRENWTPEHWMRPYTGFQVWIAQSTAEKSHTHIESKWCERFLCCWIEEIDIKSYH